MATVLPASPPSPDAHSYYLTKEPTSPAGPHSTNRSTGPFSTRHLSSTISSTSHHFSSNPPSTIDLATPDLMTQNHFHTRFARKVYRPKLTRNRHFYHGKVAETEWNHVLFTKYDLLLNLSGKTAGYPQKLLFKFSRQIQI